MSTKISHLKDKSDNVVGIRVKTAKETFTIPVVDVRVSEDKRCKANQMIKEANRQRGSRFINNKFSKYA